MNEQLQKALDTIIKVADPDKVILFGSQAKGMGNPDSDYDFLILKKRNKKKKEISSENLFEFI